MKEFIGRGILLAAAECCGCGAADDGNDNSILVAGVASCRLDEGLRSCAVSGDDCALRRASLNANVTSNIAMDDSLLRVRGGVGGASSVTWHGPHIEADSMRSGDSRASGAVGGDAAICC